jgi:ABC-2 type transport system ATP-binding protein
MHARAVLAAVILLTAACSSNTKDSSSVSTAATTPATQASAAPPPTTAPSTDVATTDVATSEETTTPPTAADSAPSTDVEAKTCVAPQTASLDAASVGPTNAGGAGEEWSITSFDGAVIRAHWFPVEDLGAGATAATVLMGPGWGSAADTHLGTAGDDTGIASLLASGFNVLTWDPRGFGQSTGTIEVDSPEFEGRDVEQLIDWVASQPQAELDAAGDPRLGMVGGSYGGGIQLVTAAIDCRIDAIVPIIAWHSLQTSLFKADTPKTGWAGLLAAASAGRNLDPTITRANATGPTGVVDPADVQWFADRGPGELVDHITVPTLIIQGTVDTLFTLDEGVTNFEAIAANDVPVAMLWFCGGHGACLTPAGDEARSGQAALAWLQRYVQGDTSVDVGTTFEFVDQDGVSYTADDFPTVGDQPLTGTGSGSLELTAAGGAGPASADGPGLAPLVAPITPAKATNAVNVSIPAASADTVLVGAPHLTMTYSGTVADGTAPTRVFAQLVDDTTGLVLGNQITPIEVTLDGAAHTVDVPLEMIAFTSHAGSSITLQIVATTVAYAQPRLGGSIDFESISIGLPVVDGVTRTYG